MRLKKIKLAGFKSFVDPTVLELPSNLVGVVGPNGCGKSNVIDAVRWVLGESSAKNLRGESMSDVIFNGSSGRKPVGQASIELVFDNSDGSLGGEYASYAEISIRRVASRDNQSNYFLNGTKCRRRDITEIFLGTGLGPRSYAIIEQGMISRVIEAKPEDLRGFLEEAAGISLYRKRRGETETRMRHTRENLARLDDIRQELDKQLERLKRQSESALRYQGLKEEQEQIERDLTSIRWRSLDSQLQVQTSLIHQHALAYEEKMSGKTSVDLELERLRQKHQDQNDICNKIQSQYYELGSEVTRLEQMLQNQRDRQQELQRDLLQTEQRVQQLNSQYTADSGRLEATEIEMTELEPEREEAVLVQEKAKTQLQEVELTMRHWEEGFEHFQRQAELPQRTAEAEKARLEQLDRQSRDLDNKIRKLTEELLHLETLSREEKIGSLEAELQAQETLQKDRAENLGNFLSQLTETRQQQSSLTLALDQAKNQGHILQGRVVSLEALQQAALGKTDAHIVAWLESHNIQDRARIAEQITVEPGYELAVETVLGSALEAICVENLEALASKVSELSTGTLTLIDKIDKTRAFSNLPKPIGSVVDSVVDIDINLDLNSTLVKSADFAKSANSGKSQQAILLASKIQSQSHISVQGFCEGVYVVDDLGTALLFRDELLAFESVITREGIWLGKDWLKVYRGSDGKSGVLAREAELKQIHETLAKLKQELSSLEAEYTDNRHKIASLEQERESLLRTDQDQTQVIKILSTQLSRERAGLEHTCQRLSLVQEEVAENKQKLSLTQEETAIARFSLQTAIDLMADFEGRRAALQEERNRLRELLKQATFESRGSQEKMQALALKHQALLSQKEATQENIARLQEHCASATERNQQLQMALEECISPQFTLRENLETFLERRLGVEETLNNAREVLSDIEGSVRQLEKQRVELEQAAEAIRSELEQTRMRGQALEVRLQAINEKLLELNVIVSERLAQIPSEANETEWATRLEQVNHKIQRLGAINMAAIEEYQSEMDRKNYLDLQTKDLTEALETLENAIRKIDRETRARFKEVYEKVNQEFQQLFPRLFGGGQAYLELLGEDLLEAGLSVMARPPGKRNSSIQLLSGGEKTLTAVALVFSIFQLNPAPFCMLDEVDAPLDDANVVRFSNLVKHMSASLQFIYITHNKITMGIADHLVGVTMKEPGVSRLVSVNVAEAVEMAVN